MCQYSMCVFDIYTHEWLLSLFPAYVLEATFVLQVDSVPFRAKVQYIFLSLSIDFIMPQTAGG